MLIENATVKKVHLMGMIHQTLAGAQQGLKTMEVWLLTLPPGAASPLNQHYAEAVSITLKGTGRAMVDGVSLDLVPDTTLVIPPHATRQVANTGEEDLVMLIIRSLVQPSEKPLMESMRNMLR